MKGLMDQLRERQGGRTQEEFAAFLGISQAGLSYLYNGGRKLGIKNAQAIAKAYPDLTDAVTDYLLGREASDNTTNTEAAG